MNAQVTVETINPKTAAEWLENKWDEQRPIMPNHVLRLASEIKSGKFRLTSDAVVLLKGRLANGQHRLSAIVQAGKSAQFIVMRSNDDELYKVIDCGMKRTVADVLGLMPYSKAIASAARLVLTYDRSLLGRSGENFNGEKNQVTRSQILEYIYANQAKLTEESAFTYHHYPKSRILGTTVATAFLHIASRKFPEQAKAFIEHVYTGEAADASIDFRDRMIRQMGTKSRLRQAYVFALLIKAWKSYKNGTRPGTLKMAEGEEFPEIL